MAGYDINSIQPYLSTDLTATSYANGGGNQTNYPQWLQQNLQQRNNSTNYTTFDPRLFADPHYQTLGVNNQQTTGGHNMVNSFGYDPKTDLSSGALDSYAQQRADQQAAQNQAGNLVAQSWASDGYDTQGKKLGDPISPGALGALKNAQPDLNNRRPSLAAGWGGWDQGSTAGPAGNANFTYFSRFS